MSCFQILNKNLFEILGHSQVENVESTIYEMVNMYILYIHHLIFINFLGILWTYLMTTSHLAC